MDRIDIGMECVATVSTILQPEYVLQIISIVLTCFSVLVSLLYTIHKWREDATKDGKITSDEIDELKKDIDEATEKIEQMSNKKDGKE